MRKNYYSILGVSRSAELAAIHSAFRTLARRYHPDIGEFSSPAKFREALEAYQALRDPIRRQQHDTDLGLIRRERTPAPEPLFARPPLTRAAPEYFAYSRSALDEFLSEIMTLMDVEFNSPLRFF